MYSFPVAFGIFLSSAGQVGPFIKKLVLFQYFITLDYIEYAVKFLNQGNGMSLFETSIRLCHQSPNKKLFMTPKSQVQCPKL